MRALLLGTILTLPLTGFPASCNAQDLDKELAVATENTRLEFKVQWCRIAQAAGMPMKLDPKVRSELDAASGPDKVRELLLPVARVNNAYGCFCSVGEARKDYKCP